jgi:hypothetical protein
VSTRDYYVRHAPGPPGDGAQDPELWEQADHDVRLADQARNDISLAWHALDIHNYAAAKAAIDKAAFWISALEAAGRRRD